MRGFGERVRAFSGQARADLVLTLKPRSSCTCKDTGLAGSTPQRSACPVRVRFPKSPISCENMLN